MALVGNKPRSVAAADLNSDSGAVSVLRNNGNGTFAAKVDYAAGDGPTSVAAADLNGDGRPSPSRAAA